MSENSHSTKQRRALLVHGGRLTAPSGRVFDVSAAPVVIGRGLGLVPEGDEPPASGTPQLLSLEDPEVSAVHCEVVAEPEGVLVRDLGSKNGTFIGSVRVRGAYLTGPCTLVLGSSRVLFEPTGRESLPIAEEARFGELVGGSLRMRRVFQQLKLFAPANLTVLVTGETGTGKELVARAIHGGSARQDGPFVVVDCTTIVSTLAESQLFGTVRGAYTGAVDAPGKFEQADGGTLFLDEIGELPLDLQPKLLRVLEDRSVQRLGDSRYRKVDVRVLSATNRDLLKEINDGRFRLDLYQRLRQVQVSLPPLRDRREDISAIVRAVCSREGHPARAQEVLDLVEAALSKYPWPGNIRELVRMTEGVVQLAPGSVSLDGDQEETVALESFLQLAMGKEVAAAGTAYAKAKRAAIEAFDREYFVRLHQETGGNVSEMGQRSGLLRHHVRAHLKRLGLRAAKVES